MSKKMLLVISLLIPFFITGIFYYFSYKSNSDDVKLFFIVIFLSSLIPVYSMNFVKKSFSRILFGVLIVPFYIFLLIAWYFSLGFFVFGDAL
jgi:hypothetical protein